MKRQHTYEQVINQKLNGLSAPDVAGLWNDMEAILDREMPGKEEKKRRIGAWWINANLLVAAGLFLAVGSVYTLCQVAGKQRAVPTPEMAASPVHLHAQETGAPQQSTETSHSPEFSTAAPVFHSNKIVSGTNVSNETAELSATVEKAQPATGNNALVMDATEATASTVVAAEESTVMVMDEENTQATDITIPVDGFDVLKATPPAVFQMQAVKTVASVSDAKKIKRARIYVDNGLTAGLSLNAPFPLNTQVRSNLDMKGQDNKVQDYIPSVYAQLHLSKKFYVQAEWQPVAAQYTPNFTLYNRIDVLNPDEKEQKVVKLNKLFYSNVPVSFHYKTPVKNLTVGVGVQYSKLKKVVLQDQEYYHLIQAGGVFKVDARKDEVVVKDPEDVRSHNTGDVVDSVAGSFRREDWRLLADVGYHYKGFNLGVRYTSGINNYINSNFTNLAVKDRNQSLQLYLRFNLFDARRK